MTSTIRDLTELLAVAPDDYILISDTSDVTNRDKRISKLNFSGGLMTGGGGVATGGFTLTVPATGVAALKGGAPVAGRVASWLDANTVQDGGFALSDIARLSQSAIFTNRVQGTSYRSDTLVSIADQSFASYSLVAGYGRQGVLIIGPSGGSDATVGGVFFFRSNGSPFCTPLAVGSNTNATTGALTGTTGATGKLTVSVDASGTLYVENRRGSTLSFVFLLIN